jgi:glycosyltransferase involved in cell wall biosynthesis
MPDLPKTYDLVCVSKASPQKNLPALFNALAQLAQTGNSPSLLLIGSAATDAHLRQQAEEDRLAVTFIPRVANFELPGYLNQARAFILPSLYEGHPKALLEAMSCGLPCIGTDVPGIREDLQHLKTGYLCRPEATSIAEAIRTVVDNLEMQEILGGNARSFISKQYSLSTILDLELTIIEKALTTS